MIAEILTALSLLPMPIQIVLIVVGLYLIKTGSIDLPKYIVGKKKKTEVQPCLAPSCPTLTKSLSQEEKIAQIKYHDTIYEQMSIVETAGVYIIDMLSDIFVKLLDEKDLNKVERHNALEVYQLIIDGGIFEVTGFLRKWIKRNHLTEMNDVEYQAYIHSRTSEAQKLLKKYIDRKYLKSVLQVDREDLLKANMEMFYKGVTPMMNDIFVKIRTISEEKQKEIKRIREGE